MIKTRVSRRTVLKAGALAGFSMAVPGTWLARAPRAARVLVERPPAEVHPAAARWSGTDIPIAQPDSVTRRWWQPGVTHYTIDIAPVRRPAAPRPAEPDAPVGLRPGPAIDFRHLGGVIAVKRGTPVQITFRNHLPDRHILPVDRTIMGTEGQDNRADVHLHGGLVPWTSDGGPHAWWDPTATRASFINNDGPAAGPGACPANEAEYYYPNDQGSRLVWYHDHAHRHDAAQRLRRHRLRLRDLRRLRARPRRRQPPARARSTRGPSTSSSRTRSSSPTQIERRDPTWTKVMPRLAGRRPLVRPRVRPDRWELCRDQPAGPPPDPSCVPEFFGDTILVNGTVYPYLEVERRQYRLRMLNACQARFLNPRLVYAKAPSEPTRAQQGGRARLRAVRDRGRLPAGAGLPRRHRPVAPGGPTPSQLLLAPAERADLIVDFRDVPAGSRLLLVSDAPAPYPMGDADWTPSRQPGHPESSRASAPTPGRCSRSGSRPARAPPTRRSACRRGSRRPTRSSSRRCPASRRPTRPASPSGASPSTRRSTSTAG